MVNLETKGGLLIDLDMAKDIEEEASNEVREITVHHRPVSTYFF